MKTCAADPWSRGDSVDESASEDVAEDCFEDSFISTSQSEGLQRLPDSEQYLARLQYKLKAIKGGTSKRDLVNSLSVAKEDCIARLITAGENLESAEEQELAANPLIRHIAPHLQALTAVELVHLLKADELQKIVDEQNQVSENEDIESKSTDSQPDVQIQDSNGL